MHFKNLKGLSTFVATEFAPVMYKKIEQAVGAIDKAMWAEAGANASNPDAVYQFQINGANYDIRFMFYSDMIDLDLVWLDSVSMELHGPFNSRRESLLRRVVYRRTDKATDADHLISIILQHWNSEVASVMQFQRRRTVDVTAELRGADDERLLSKQDSTEEEQRQRQRLFKALKTVRIPL